MKKILSAVIACACLASAAAFGGCAVGGAEITYALSEDGSHYIVSGYEGDERAITELIVPETYSAGEGGQELPVTEIGDRAFAKCPRLTKVSLTNNITKIDDFAFYWSSVTEITIPDSVTEIGYFAFGFCDCLTEIRVPASVTTLEDKAFYGCSSVKTAYIGATVTDIGDGLLQNRLEAMGGNVFSDTSLTTVYFSASVQKINATALMGNIIADIYFAGTEEQWDVVYFYEIVAKADKPGEYEEKKLDKATVMGSTKMHFNVQF